MSEAIINDYKKFGMVKKMALEFLDSLKERVMNDCDEQEILDTMAKYHPSVNKDYFNPKDYCNYDEACKILHLSSNRAKLRQLCDEYGIECVYVKNRPLGFPKKDIERLAELLKEDVKERERKEKRKKGQKRFLW